MVGVGSGALPWRRAHGRGQEHAVDSSGLVWSLPVGAEGREERVGRGNGLGGRLRGLLHRSKHDGMATAWLLPGIDTPCRPLGHSLDALVLAR